MRNSEIASTGGFKHEACINRIDIGSAVNQKIIRLRTLTIYRVSLVIAQSSARLNQPGR